MYNIYIDIPNLQIIDCPPFSPPPPPPAFCQVYFAIIDNNDKVLFKLSLNIFASLIFLLLPTKK